MYFFFNVAYAKLKSWENPNPFFIYELTINLQITSNTIGANDD